MKANSSEIKSLRLQLYSRNIPEKRTMNMNCIAKMSIDQVSQNRFQTNTTTASNKRLHQTHIKMKFSTFAIFTALATGFIPALQAVTREECKEDYLPGVLECIDSFTGKTNCDLLPIPDFAMPQNQVNEKGYWIQQLRDTPTSHVFAVSENAYLALMMVDIPVS